MNTENIKYKIALYNNIRRFVIAHGVLDKEHKQVVYEMPANGEVPTLFVNHIGVSRQKIEKIVYRIADDTNTEMLEFYGKEPYAIGSLFDDRLENKYKLDSVHEDKLETIMNYLNQHQ